MPFAKFGSYLSAAGLVGLAVYHLSNGDLAAAVAAITAAFGIGTAAHSGPKPE